MTQGERSKEAWKKWRGLVSEQARSGQSVAAFCRERNLCAPHFYWWKKRLRESAATKPACAGRFVEVQVAASGAGLVQATSAALQESGGRQLVVSVGDSRIEIRLRNGRSLMVGRGFDPEHVRALLAVVEAAG
jgi:hypothetical protein